MGSVNPLAGRSVLIVEDEPLVALEVHRAMSEAGASVIAATSLSEATKLIPQAGISAAVPDINLGGEDCSTVCEALAKRNIPFMF